MTSIPIAAAVSAALSLAAIPAAGAELPCGPRPVIAETLATEFGETPVATGVAASGARVEIFAAASGSWTLVVLMPTGLACVVAAGEGWHPPPRAVPERPA